MSLVRLALRLALGRRLPVMAGELHVPGPTSPIVIRRDSWGVPHIDAETDADAWFGLGFCHAQDRGFQLETLVRVGRGTLAELVGKAGVGLDRLSRRVGFRRAADAQLPVLDADVRAGFDGYVAGVNAGFAHGLTALPHEFTLLRTTPTRWDPADVLAFLKLQSFLLPSNWDVELARLKALRADGPDAVRDLDPTYPDWLPATVPVGATAGDFFDRLDSDLRAFREFAPSGGGSNNWVIAGSRTLSGKPLLASDPHLSPTIPGPWYLAHVRTPEWSVAGATFAGAPAFPIGHNGFACWGVTAGLTDNTDLFLETVGPDGKSVRAADGTFTPCDVLRETIRVKNGPDVVEDVLLTPRGPLLSPAVTGTREAVSIAAVWLQPRPLRGFFDSLRAKDFDTFRWGFAKWPMMPLNVLYADASGATGWQLVGQLPVRRAGNGMIPLPADRLNVGWEPDLVPFAEMPFAVNPPAGFLATANNPPTTADSVGPFLGNDYVDGYRVAAILAELGKHAVGWTVADCLKLQRNVRSVPWAEIRDSVLSLPAADADAAAGLALLRDWDGDVAADSPAAAVFELFLADMAVRVAKAKAPTAWAALVGGDGDTAVSQNLFSDRRVGHLVRLVRTTPAGWFPRPWPDELADAIGAAVRHLRTRFGPGPQWWHWGDVRPLVLEHPVFKRVRLLAGVFNRGPVPCGGDQNTISQAGVRPTAPTAPTHNMANLRAVFDAADFANSRFVLAGGQSGNPFSPHYDDQFRLWRTGDAVPIPFAPADVLRSATAMLRLLPAG
ncbi:MAG: penicillin acylase family protein [Fimbriiglobus sp.]